MLNMCQFVQSAVFAFKVTGATQGSWAFQQAAFWSNPQHMGMIILGILLILAELFVPGGILGAIGIILILVAVFLSTDSILAFLMFSFAILGVTALFLFALFKLIPKKYLHKTLILGTRLTREEGFSTSVILSEYKGQSGKTFSILRPTGKVMIKDQILDAMAETGFIQEGANIIVIRTEGSKLIVREEETNSE